MKTGRPRKNSIDGFASAVDACIAAYEETDNAAELTDYTLAKRLGISQDMLDNYYTGAIDAVIARQEEQRRKDLSDKTEADNAEDEESSQTSAESSQTYIKRTYSAELKRLIQYRSNACVAHIAKGGQVTGWIFLSKQKRWGGFSDTQSMESQNTSEITVKIKGANGKELH